MVIKYESIKAFLKKNEVRYLSYKLSLFIPSCGVSAEIDK